MGIIVGRQIGVSDDRKRGRSLDSETDGVDAYGMGFRKWIFWLFTSGDLNWSHAEMIR